MNPLYNIQQQLEHQIIGKKCYEGESIEAKIKRIVEDKEPIEAISEPVYGTREEGVNPSTNIRSDRWDYAIDAMDAASRSKAAKRDAKAKKDMGEQAKEGMAAEGQGE